MDVQKDLFEILRLFCFKDDHPGEFGIVVLRDDVLIYADERICDLLEMNRREILGVNLMTWRLLSKTARGKISRNKSGRYAIWYHSPISGIRKKLLMMPVVLANNMMIVLIRDIKENVERFGASPTETSLPEKKLNRDAPK